MLTSFGCASYTGFSLAGLCDFSAFLKFIFPIIHASTFESDTYPFHCSPFNKFKYCLFLFQFQVKEVFDAIAPVVGLSVGSAVGQSSIADEVSSLVRKPKQEFYPTIDEEYVQMEPQTKIDILVATPGRLMDHINMTNGFSLEHLQYLVGLLEFYCIIHSRSP